MVSPAVDNLVAQLTRLPGMAPMGIGMMTKGRIGFRPHQIKGREGLRRILVRAEELEHEA